MLGKYARVFGWWTMSDDAVVYCGDCLYPMNECEHGREFKG